MEETTANDGIRLPGFRFHPTEEELLSFYLKRVVVGKRLNSNIIGFLNIYHHEPWDLPGLAMIGEREWYFIVPRERKQGSGGKPNRTTEKGFWKATGSDRRIVSFSDPKRVIGLRKTLVFYRGRAPRGRKTDWVMNEYRLPDNCPLPKEMVLCKIYMKATSLKVLEQRAAMEEGSKSLNTSPSSSLSSLSSVEIISFCNQEPDISPSMAATQKVFKTELGEFFVKMEEETKEREGSSMILQMPPEMEKLSELEVHRWSHGWTQDPVWNQLGSPWLQSLTHHYPDVPNF